MGKQQEELTVLRLLSENEGISQRELSEQAGISLGNVNALLKKFAKVGYLKREKLNAKNIRYILTPKGFTTLSAKTLEYIAKSFRAVKQLNQQVKVIVEQYELTDTVYILGPKDEIYEIVYDALLQEGLIPKQIQSLEEAKEDYYILHWYTVEVDDCRLLNLMTAK